jgi:septal ring factor EnvC (AmiA/AmiB activator)
MKFRVCFLLTAFGISPALYAVTDAVKKSELQEVQSKIQQVGADVRVLAAEKSEQLEQLRKLEKHFGELINAVNTIKSQIAHQERVLQEVRNKVAATQKDIRTHQRGLEGLIKAVAAMGDKDNLKIVLNPSDPTLSSRMSVYYDYIGKARLQKLQAIQEDFQTLRQLESQKDSEAQLLQISLDKKQQETDALHALKNQREHLLAKINSNVASKTEQLQRLVHDEKKLESLLASLPKTDDNGFHQAPQSVESVRPTQHSSVNTEDTPKKPEPIVNETVSSQPFESLKGQLPWPVQGPIAERFGSKRFEVTWDGVVINGREGADVHAVASGRVVYADWFRGYGLMVIIDHGKGYLSLYAFNQNISKNVGAHVKAGDTIASVGRSGGRSQAALYFGIRSKGRPVNPEHWCRK